MEVKTIGVLTSGGDSPGMNAAVRAVTRAALAKGIKVYGIRRGYNGLIHDDVFEMTLRTVSDIIHRGGTILYTARSPEFKTEEGMAKAIATCKKYGIDGCVVIGGDGSYRGARDLSLHGIPCVGLPGTIDNDIACTDETIGFDTAMNTAVEMIDRLRDTAQSHERCSICEVMGRNCGDIALHTGIAVGATAIIVPEVEYSFDQIIAQIKEGQSTGKEHFIIVVAEGVGGVEELAKKIEDATGIESRATILGHVQRGGNASLRDRVLASNMGHKAVEILSQGIGNRVVAIHNSEIVDYDIYEALQMKNKFDYHLYDISKDLNI